MLLRPLCKMQQRLSVARHLITTPVVAAATGLPRRYLLRTVPPLTTLTVSYRCCSSAGAGGSSGACISTPLPVLNTVSATGQTGKGNFFAFFELSPQPEIDVAALQKRYHDLQRRVHPDQAQVQAQEQQQKEKESSTATPCVPAESHSSVDVSTYANAAYEALRSPYNRCRYLSQLVKATEVKGSQLTPQEEEELMIEDDRRTMHARAVSPDAPVDDDFLTEMLFMNELIFGADAEEEGVKQQWVVLRADLEDRAVGYFKDAVQHWAAKDLAQFHHTVQEWTYVNNALNNLKERMLQCA